MNVLVTGPESSGTRFVSRWLEAHPEIAARHWSAPSGTQWAKHWPDVHDFGGEPPDAVLVCVRDFTATTTSQHARELVASRKQAEANTVLALLRCLSWAVSHGYPVHVVVYDSVVAHPERFRHVFDWLGLPPVDAPEPVFDGSAGRLA